MSKSDKDGEPNRGRYMIDVRSFVVVFSRAEVLGSFKCFIRCVFTTAALRNSKKQVDSTVHSSVSLEVLVKVLVAVRCHRVVVVLVSCSVFIRVSTGVSGSCRHFTNNASVHPAILLLTAINLHLICTSEMIYHLDRLPLMHCR